MILVSYTKLIYVKIIPHVLLYFLMENTEKFLLNIISFVLCEEEVD